MIRIRLALAFLGLALCIAGIALDDRRIVWAAIVVLAVALALRFKRKPES